MVDTEDKSYLITVIVPVYNVRQYIDDCIKSIINQDIGFEENIKIIIVNDGSTDGSDKLCRDYSEKYENIQFIDKKNGGVSSARNIGIKHLDSKYVAFLDSDDKVSKQFYRILSSALEANEDIPFAVGRTKNFEGGKGYHIGDFRFESSRVIDLKASPEMIQTLPSPVLFRANSIGQLRFNENMTHAEDSEFINRVLLNNEPKYYVSREAIYFYRKRRDQSSATAAAKHSKTYYTSLDELIHSLTASCDDNMLPDFIQYALIYQLGWRLRLRKKPDSLTQKEWVTYKNVISNAINSISDEILLGNSVSMRMKEKRSALVEKYFSSRNRYKPIVAPSEQAMNLSRKDLNFYVDDISYDDKYLYIRGDTLLYDPDIFKFDYEMIINDVPVEYTRCDSTYGFMDEEIVVKSGRLFKVPLDQRGDIRIRIDIDGHRDYIDLRYKSTLEFGMRRFNFMKTNKIILSRSNNYPLKITNYSHTKLVFRQALLAVAIVLTFARRVVRHLRYRIDQICLIILNCVPRN